ncbi:unnamed protein product [Polarella glacialis]|uniref:Uncharacterized protein n=1 Tax=Polarella glacialis TaxID=89957 RepID=A0A813G8F9_POLGL|nr:unnamed protein product [Polarella glacialis]
MDGSEGEGEGNSEEASQQQSFQEALELALPWRREWQQVGRRKRASRRLSVPLVPVGLVDEKPDARRRVGKVGKSGDL